MGFRGGYVFKGFAGEACPECVPAVIPEEVRLPLGGFTPLAGSGSLVRAGQPLLMGDNSLIVPCPVNGTIASIDDDAITIVSDGSDGYVPVPGHIREPWRLSPDALYRTLRESGAALLFGGRFLVPEHGEAIRRVIVSAVATDPVTRGWHPSFIGVADDFSAGLRTLAALFPLADRSIVHTPPHRRWFEDAGLADLAVMVSVTARYPQEHPVLLARAVEDDRGPCPSGAGDDSVLVIPYSDVIQLALCMSLGRPFIDRTVCLGGPGVSRPLWYQVRIGVSYADLLKQYGKKDEFGPWRVIRNSTLTGEVITDLSRTISHDDSLISVIGDRAERVLFQFMRPGFDRDAYPRVTVASVAPVMPKALETAVHGGLRPCVQCNYCDEVCPAGLYPFLIAKLVGIDAIDETFRLHPADCIDCGLCDYVCPSKIEVRAAVKRAADAFRAARGGA